VKRLLIVGAGGFGREVLCWARDVEPTQTEWRIGGFLDANATALDGFDVPLEILGDPAEFAPAETDLCICAIGDPATKQRVVTGLAALGAHFATLIHPSVITERTAGSARDLSCARVVVVNIACDTGRFVTLNVGATVGHDGRLGDWCSLYVHADLAGEVSLGEAVLAGSHSFVLPGVTVWGSRSGWSGGRCGFGMCPPGVLFFWWCQPS